MSLVLALICLGGCLTPFRGGGPERSATRQWPAPPETARIRYLGMLGSQEDMPQASSWMDGFSNVLFGKKPIGALMTPMSVVVSPAGVLYVADGMGKVVHAFDYTNKTYEQFGNLSAGTTLQRPVALALAEGQVLVSDSQLHQVAVFRSDGTYVQAWGRLELKRPTGIAYHARTGEVWVVDTGDHMLKVFDSAGRLLRRIGSRGSGPGQFNYPTYLWLDQQERLYVTDALNYRIQVLTLDGRVLNTLGGHGDRPGNFGHPSGVATDQQGHIYVADRQFENIQIFDDRGQILMAWGHEGRGIGEFWLPAGLFIDRKNRIFVADSFNKRIQIFQLLEPNDDT